MKTKRVVEGANGIMMFDFSAFGNLCIVSMF